MRKHLLTAAILLASASGAHATTVAGVPSGSFLDTPQAGYGQAFTTAPGSSYDDLTFNFYTTTHIIAPPLPYYYSVDHNYPTTPYAVGTGYLLSQEYLGSPAALSTTTPGFLGMAVAANNLYTFAPSLTLSGGTQYFFYEDGFIPLNTVIFFADPRGGPEYTDPGNDPTVNFQRLQTGSSYLLTGVTVAATPEPTGILLLGSGVLALAGAVRRRSR